jgi:hypothetical protein
MLRSLIRIGFTRGVGGSRSWLVVGMTAGGLHLLRRMATREPKTVYLEELHPGQSLIIRHLPPAP